MLQCRGPTGSGSRSAERDISWAFLSKEGLSCRRRSPFSGAQGIAGADHNAPTRIATPRARQPSSNMVCKNFVRFAPVCRRPGEAAARCSGNSSTSRRLIAIWSDRSGRSKGSRAMIGASASAARAFGKEASWAASSQGSKPSRVKPETTLSGIPFCSLPIAAKRKSLRSEWSSENRADSAMLVPGLNRLP
jgi:hypothetical protein